MKAKIALATVSGKAYYLLVNELKKRGLPFLSLKPSDNIPLDIKVVITTEKERGSIEHSNVLVFKDEQDASKVVDEAVQIVKGKRGYEKLVIGVDPGKTFGVAIVGDGNVLDTSSCSSLRETVNIILEALDKSSAPMNIIRIGDGAPEYTTELINSLDEALSSEVTLEIVSEAGTSHFMGETAQRRELKDAMSAIKIAERKGRVLHRGEAK